MRGPFAAILLAALGAGCVESLITVEGTSRFAYACRLVDPLGAPDVELQMWRGDGVTLDLLGPAAALAHALANATGRELADFTFSERKGPDAPRDGWNRTLLEEWSLRRPPPAVGDLSLHVLWLAGWPTSGERLGPGAIVVSQQAVTEGAARLGRSAPEVARILLLHYAGHALGVVNDGIPVQDPNLQEREGPANHEPDRLSVMHAGWHQASTMAWEGGARYDRYSEGVRQDWQAAVAPAGACKA